MSLCRLLSVTPPFPRVFFASYAFLSAWLILAGAPAARADVPGSRDHPEIDMRYPGATITAYAETEYDEYRLLIGKVVRRNEPGETIDLEGRITRITYVIAAERSTLEVMRNYEKALTTMGFDVLFACKNETCGGRAFNHTVVPYLSGFAENYEDQRFRAARLERPEGTVYASLYITKNYSVGGPTRNKVYLQLDVIETEPMDVGMEVVTADAMQKAIEEQGKVAIHSILFALDSAEILPQSRPALDEIGEFLRRNPDLAVLVVGHTDNQGSLDYNLGLSERRAKAVVEDLRSTYGVAPSRMSGHGVAFLAPVAPNTDEEGRRLNRRVELVRR